MYARNGRCHSVCTLWDRHSGTLGLYVPYFVVSAISWYCCVLSFVSGDQLTDYIGFTFWTKFLSETKYRLTLSYWPPCCTVLTLYPLQNEFCIWKIFQRNQLYLIFCCCSFYKYTKFFLSGKVLGQKYRVPAEGGSHSGAASHRSHYFSICFIFLCPCFGDSG